MLFYHSALLKFFRNLFWAIWVIKIFRTKKVETMLKEIVCSEIFATNFELIEEVEDER